MPAGTSKQNIKEFEGMQQFAGQRRLGQMAGDVNPERRAAFERDAIRATQEGLGRSGRVLGASGATGGRGQQAAAQGAAQGLSRSLLGFRLAEEQQRFGRMQQAENIKQGILDRIQARRFGIRQFEEGRRQFDVQMAAGKKAGQDAAGAGQISGIMGLGGAGVGAIFGGPLGAVMGHGVGSSVGGTTESLAGMSSKKASQGG